MATLNKTLFAQLKEGSAPTDIPSSAWSSAPARWVLIVVAVLAVAALLPRSSVDTQSDGYDQTRLGTIWSQEDVVADYAFPVRKSQQSLQQDRLAATTGQPLIFSESSGPNQPLHMRLGQSTSQLPAEARVWVRQHWSAILLFYTQRKIIDIPIDSIASDVVLFRQSATKQDLLDKSKLADTSMVMSWIDNLVKTAPNVHRAAIRHSLVDIIDPTIEIDHRATDNAKLLAIANVPQTSGIVRKGDVIVSNGQRLDKPTLLRLASYRNAQHLRSETSFSLFMVLGGLMHSILIIGFIATYLKVFRPVSYYRNGQLGTLLTFPIIAAALSWLSLRIDPILPFEYLIIVPAFSMIVTILYDSRAALAITVVMALAAGAARGDDYGIVFVLLFGGAMGIYGTRNLQGRTQIFTSIISVFGGIVFATLAVELLRQTPLELMWPKLIVGTSNAVLSPLLTFAVIIVFEKLFNVATDIRLEEFDTTNHKVLKTLNERAPGTYQHTMSVARLSESAANAIGANTVLTRVGAYFHDIGKMEKAEYFVENQIGMGNKHDHLTPKKSAAIIRQHVQDGIELAHEYGLPERVWKFIPMHHGTILIKHFYATAVIDAEEQGLTVDPADYRYSGPKPDSKETAIVMLADAVEALSRLADTTSRSAVEKAVETMIVERVVDGQLVNTPLTLSDLDVIKESFVKSIIGMSHRRIQYKTVDDPKSES